MYFVDIAPRLGQLSEDTISGEGLFNAGGIAATIGTNVLDIFEGRQLIARGLSQAIGRNLGLEYTVVTSNLMSQSANGNTSDD